MGAYKEDFPVGTRVRIRDGEFLQAFRSRWRWHHPLESNHLEFASRECTVATVGFYHGGDVLYTLDRVPGTWHEECLEAAD